MKTLHFRFPAKGFTLIEILMAVTIMSIALIPMMRFFPEAVAIDNSAENTTVALFLAERKMEETVQLLHSNFTDLSSSGDFTDWGFDDYQYQLITSDSPGDGGVADKLMAVTVTVQHTEIGQQVVLDTKVAKRQ